MNNLLEYNSHDTFLYCEECGFLACAYPEKLEVGSECRHCKHILGTTGVVYNYETNLWDYALLEEMYD